jgi:MYXO-CTERM domain-containing protein
VCDVPSGQCVACNTDAQCKADEQCTAHACVPKPPPDAGAEVGDQESVGGDSGCSCSLEPSRSPNIWLALTAGLAFVLRRKKRVE